MNEQEKEQFEAELKALGMSIITHAEIEGNHGLGIEVDLDTSIDYSNLVEQDFVLRKKTGRDDFFYIMLKKYDKEAERLTMVVATPVDDQKFNYYMGATATLDSAVGTNFPDLCWYHAEGTTELTKDEVMTKFREDAQLGDLTWILPTRIVDNFIEVMHTLNQSFLQGLMQETICYGPILMTDNA